MSLSKFPKFPKFHMPVEKLDVRHDTIVIKNLLKSGGITNYEPDVLDKLLKTGYDLIKDELLKRKHREDIAEAVGNIVEPLSLADGFKDTAFNPADHFRNPLEIELLGASSTVHSEDMDNSFLSSSALISVQPLNVLNETEDLGTPSDSDSEDTDSSGPSSSDSNSDELSSSPESDTDTDQSSSTLNSDKLSGSSESDTETDPSSSASSSDELSGSSESDTDTDSSSSASNSDELSGSSESDTETDTSSSASNSDELSGSSESDTDTDQSSSTLHSDELSGSSESDTDTDPSHTESQPEILGEHDNLTETTSESDSSYVKP